MNLSGKGKSLSGGKLATLVRKGEWAVFTFSFFQNHIWLGKCLEYELGGNRSRSQVLYKPVIWPSLQAQVSNRLQRQRQ